MENIAQTQEWLINDEIHFAFDNCVWNCCIKIAGLRDDDEMSTFTTELFGEVVRTWSRMLIINFIQFHFKARPRVITKFSLSTAPSVRLCRHIQGPLHPNDDKWREEIELKSCWVCGDGGHNWKFTLRSLQLCDLFHVGSHIGAVGRSVGGRWRNIWKLELTREALEYDNLHRIILHYISESVKMLRYFRSAWSVPSRRVSDFSPHTPTAWSDNNKNRKVWCGNKVWLFGLNFQYITHTSASIIPDRLTCPRWKIYGISNFQIPPSSATNE